MPEDTLTITDSRTNKTYTLPVENGTIRAMDLRQIKDGPDDFGLMTYDPAFMNTASCKSAITYIDGDKGILRYRGYPIEVLAERCTFLEVAYLLLFGELPTDKELDVYKRQPVEIMFRTILCAVPAFMREDPARTSAPTSVTMAKSAARSRGELRLQVRAMVRAPRRRAYSRTAMVKGVRPLVAMPRTMSRLPGFRFFISATARDVSSSLASVEAPRALGPPAMMYCTMLGSVLKVGGISDASSAPIRPLVPAPT